MTCAMSEGVSACSRSKASERQKLQANGSSANLQSMSGLHRSKTSIACLHDLRFEAETTARQPQEDRDCEPSSTAMTSTSLAPAQQPRCRPPPRLCANAPAHRELSDGTDITKLRLDLSECTRQEHKFTTTRLYVTGTCRSTATTTMQRLLRLPRGG